MSLVKFIYKTPGILIKTFKKTILEMIKPEVMSEKEAKEILNLSDNYSRSELEMKHKILYERNNNMSSYIQDRIQDAYELLNK